MIPKLETRYQQAIAVLRGNMPEAAKNVAAEDIMTLVRNFVSISDLLQDLRRDVAAMEELIAKYEQGEYEREFVERSIPLDDEPF